MVMLSCKKTKKKHKTNETNKQTNKLPQKSMERFIIGCNPRNEWREKVLSTENS